MKIVGYLSCALGLLFAISMTDAGGFEEKVDQQFFDSLSSEGSVRSKKPFCNAFTGCGKKRSFYSENTVNSHEEGADRIRIPVPIYRALLRAANREISETLDRQSNKDNATPDVGVEYPNYMSQKIPRRDRYMS